MGNDDPGRAQSAPIDRRRLIARAAAAGALAWTAPIIVDSIASPAGALTLSGCYRFTIAATNSGCANAAILNVAALACLPNPSAACSAGTTNVTSGNINTYCLTVTQGDLIVDDCQPEYFQADDTVIFGINTGLSGCECTSPTIEAAAGQFNTLPPPLSNLVCYASGGGQVTINGAKTSVTFGNPGIGLWTRYSFVVKCS